VLLLIVSEVQKRTSYLRGSSSTPGDLPSQYPNQEVVSCCTDEPKQLVVNLNSLESLQTIKLQLISSLKNVINVS
jgi:hypothetical protein